MIWKLYFIFYSLIFKFCVGLLLCSGSTASPSPLDEEPAVDLNSASVIIVLSGSLIWVIPGPHSSRVSLANMVNSFIFSKQTIAIKPRWFFLSLLHF